MERESESDRVLPESNIPSRKLGFVDSLFISTFSNLSPSAKRAAGMRLELIHIETKEMNSAVHKM